MLQSKRRDVKSWKSSAMAGFDFSESCHSRTRKDDLVISEAVVKVNMYVGSVNGVVE